MDYDVTVIGGGPGGYVAAIRASQLGHKVALVEEKHLGGVCLNWGCIPTKTLLKSAEIYASLQKKAKTFGVVAEKVSFDYEKIVANSRSVADRLSKGIAFLMKKNNITVFSARGKLKGAHEIELSDGQSFSSRYVVLATGARPKELPHLQPDGERVWTSRHALASTVQPGHIAIIGAGAIGVEFAYFWNALGSKVVLIEMLPRILPVEDEEISAELEKIFRKQGIQIYTSTKVVALEKKEQGLSLTLERDGSTSQLEVEYALVAVGVQPNTEDLGLETVGVATERGWISVNEYCQTTVPHIYAIGDVNGPPWLAHVASAEGILAVEHLSGREVQPLDATLIPSCTYCQPQVASVGYTELQAKQEGYDVKVGKFPLRASGKALAMGEKEGFVKVVLDGKYGELLGCHILGADATELISEFTLGRAGELTYHELLHTIHPHPTLSEALHEAVHAALGSPIHT